MDVIFECRLSVSLITYLIFTALTEGRVYYKSIRSSFAAL